MTATTGGIAVIAGGIVLMVAALVVFLAMTIGGGE